MRPRMKPGLLEVVTDLLEDLVSRGWQAQASLVKQPVNVVGAEADAFHVEGVDGARQGFAFGDESSARIAVRLLPDDADEFRDVRDRCVARIGRHDSYRKFTQL